MRNVVGDEGVGGQRSPQQVDVAAAGGDHHRDVLVGQRLDRRLDQPGQVGVVDGALGDVHDRTSGAECGPPRRRGEVGGRGRCHRADEAHVVRKVGAQILELGHGRHDHPIGEHRRIQHEHGKFRSLHRQQHSLGGGVRRSQQDVVGQQLQRAVAQPAQHATGRSETRAARRGVAAAEEQGCRRVRQDGWAPHAAAEQQRQDAQERGVDEDGIEVVVRQQLVQCGGLCGHGFDEQVGDVEVEPRDTRRLRPPRQIGVERGVVVVGGGGQGDRPRSHGEDLGRVSFRGQERDLVATLGQPASCVEQRADVADGWACCDEDFRHCDSLSMDSMGVDASRWGRRGLGGWVEIGWRLQVEGSTVVNGAAAPEAETRCDDPPADASGGLDEGERHFHGEP